MSNKFLTVIYDMSRPGMQQKASLLLLEADWTASGWSHAFADRDEARKELYRLQESIAAAPQVVAEGWELPVATWFAIDHADGVQFHPSEEQALRYSESRQCVKYFSEDQMRAALQAAPVQAQEPVMNARNPCDMSFDEVTAGFASAHLPKPHVDTAPVQPVAVAVPDGWRDKLVGLTVSMDVSTGDDDAFHRVFGEVESIMPQGDSHVILAVETSRNFAAPAAQGDALADAYQRREAYYAHTGNSTIDYDGREWGDFIGGWDAAIATKAAS